MSEKCKATGRSAHVCVDQTHAQCWAQESGQWQRQYEHMRDERDGFRELYRAAQETLNEALVNVDKIKAEAWDEGCAVAHGYDLSDRLDREEFEDLTKSAPFINPYRGGE